MITTDPCFRSLSLLNQKVSTFLGSPIHMPDLQESQNVSNDFENVLATGLYYRRVFEIEYWPKNDFSFYCLSPSVKNVLVKLLHFDVESISSIPRYDLVPSINQNQNFPDWKTFTLFHAGRIAPLKNIEFLIFITFYFQLFYSTEIKLLLLGDFNNEHHKDLLGFYDLDYELKIKRLIHSLPWLGNPPKIIHQLNELEWLAHIPQNGIFISASNQISEDFSMSVAQIQEQLQTPLILPYWGAFKDVIGLNVKHYDSSLIATSNEPLKTISSKACLFVQQYLNNKLKSYPSIIDSPLYRAPQFKINRNYLKQKILQNKSVWGPEIDHLVNGKLSQFSLTQNGQNFFNHYREIFRESN
jgi:hypothetical protein